MIRKSTFALADRCGARNRRADADRRQCHLVRLRRVRLRQAVLLRSYGYYPRLMRFYGPRYFYGGCKYRGWRYGWNRY